MLFGLTIAAFLTLHAQEPSATPPGSDEAVQTAPRTQDGHRIKEPQKKKHVAPEWPNNALRAGLDGRVVLECLIGIDGRVEDVKVVKGYRSLAEAAKKAVPKWRYTTTLLDGKAVPVIMTVTVNFKLQAPPKRDDTLTSLSDSDPEIRWAAVTWLGRFRPITGEQKTALARALEDPSELVRSAAKKAIERLEAQ